MTGKGDLLIILFRIDCIIYCIIFQKHCTFFSIEDWRKHTLVQPSTSTVHLRVRNHNDLSTKHCMILYSEIIISWDVFNVLFWISLQSVCLGNYIQTVLPARQYSSINLYLSTTVRSLTRVHLEDYIPVPLYKNFWCLRDSSFQKVLCFTEGSNKEGKCLFDSDLFSLALSQFGKDQLVIFL